jgi:hypothetical protein
MLLDASDQNISCSSAVALVLRCISHSEEKQKTIKKVCTTKQELK